MNPDRRCNFDCVYCEVDRTRRGGGSRVNIGVMLSELDRMVTIAQSGHMGELGYHPVDTGLLPFREVALSGDGEPTLCPNFRQVVESIIHLRARHSLAFFKIVLITNTSGLHFPEIKAGVDLLTGSDEIWTKLDAGTQAYMDLVNSPQVSLDLVLRNIRDLGCRRPVVIQSLFPLIHGEEPPADEIASYIQRLRELKEAGTKISLVQVYSAHRAAMDVHCGHLPLRTLSRIARMVREECGLNAEVF